MSMPAGPPLPYSASSTTPATIVGSANGRSISAFTTPLPGNSSRTSTHAISVPNNALIDHHDRRHHERQLHRGQRLGARHRAPERAEVPPLAALRQQRGNREQHEHRQVHAEQARCRARSPAAPAQRRAQARRARRVCRARRSGARAPAMPASAHLARGHPQRLLDLRDDPGGAFGFEEFLAHLLPAAERVDREQARGRRELAGSGDARRSPGDSPFPPRSSGRRGRAGSRRTSVRPRCCRCSTIAIGFWIRIVSLGITYSIGEPFFWSAIASFS